MKYYTKSCIPSRIQST